MPSQFSEQESGAPKGAWRVRLQNRYLRLIAWVTAGFTVFVLLCGAALLLLLNSAKGHDYLLGLAQRKASDALGVPVELQNFALHWSTLSVDIYGIRIAGAAPHSNPPLLQADHLKVGVRVVSILGKSWYLDQIQIDHPVAWVVVDRNGQSNLPVFKSSSSGHTDLFDLGIRHVQIDRGEVYYNSRPHALTASLRNLAFKSVFTSLPKRYSGRLAYSDGNLQVGSLQPLTHDAEIEFDATPTTFTLKRGIITAGASRAIVDATVENYGAPIVKAQYRIVLDGRQAAQILHESSIPTGTVQTSGSVQFQQSTNRTALQSLAIAGSLNSAMLSLNTPTVHAGVQDLSARYSLAGGNASLENLHARILGGELTAQGKMLAIGDNQKADLRLDLHKISLAELEHALGRSAATKDVSLAGEADATATASWEKSISNLTAQADLTLTGSASRAHSKPSGHSQALTQVSATVSQSLPLQGAFHATYSNADRSLTLKESYLKSSQLNLVLNGTVSRRSSLSINFTANDLREVATFIDAFRSPETATSAIELAGRGSFHGTVSGSITSPNLAGQLSAGNLEYRGTKWKLLTAGVELSPSHAGLRNLRLEGTDRGQLTASADAELRKWTFDRRGTVQLDLSASHLPLSTFAQLTGQTIPITGTIEASAHLRGAAKAPTGNATIRVANATAYGEPVSLARVDVSGASNQVKITALIQCAAGSIQLEGTTDPSARTYDAQLTSSGIDLAKLKTAKARGIETSGLLKIQVHGNGSYDDPSATADLQLPTLTVSGQTISQTRLQLAASHHVANLDFVSSVANTPVHGKARLDLRGDYNVDGSLETGAMPLQPLLAVYAPGEAANVTGQVRLNATIHGPLKDRNKLEAQIKVPLLKVSYGNSVQLAASPIEADYQERLVRIQPVTIRGTATELSVQGAFPVGGGHAPASLQAHGTIDLGIVQLFDHDLRTSGQLKVNVDSHGTAADLLSGEIDIADAGIGTATSPVGLQHANGVLKLASDRLTITNLTGALGGGKVTAQGAVVFRPAIRLNLGAEIKGAQLLYPRGVRETADATLHLAGTSRYATLGGAVTLSNLSFTPAFDLATFVSQFSGGVAAPSAAGFQQNLRLNIAVNSSNNISLVSRTLSVDGSANLQVRGTAADPVVLGRVNLTGGDVILNGNRFVLTGGTIQFINPAMIEPVLNVALTTSIREYKIDLRFRGPTDRLRTQYISNPSLPQADIINLLAFGNTTEASAAPATQQAEGLLASQVSSQVTSRISKAAGISQLSISPVIAGGTTAGPPGANLTIQQRVTGNLFVTFSTNVATTQGQTVQGQYQVSPRVTVSATRDPNGGFALDTLIKKTW